MMCAGRKEDEDCDSDFITFMDERDRKRWFWGM